MWMRNERLRRIIGRNRIARTLTFGLQNALQMRLLSGHKDPQTLSNLRQATHGTRSLLSTDEAFILHELASAQTTVPGDFAEFGVYEGASASLLCTVKDDHTLHLFDTFEGLPASARNGENGVFHKGQFIGTLPHVRRKLADCRNVRFHPGLFPDSTSGLEDLRFSFVHLDVDLHDATLAGLDYFYPRLLPGGIILTHDFSIIPGVAQAFRTFFTDRPERIIEFPTTQAMIIRHPV